MALEFRPHEDRSTGAVLITAVAAFLVRLVYLLEFHRSVFFSSPTLDAAFHDEMARRLAAGHLLDGAPYFRAPLYSWLLGLLYALGGTSPWVPRLLQAALAAAATGALTWAAAKLLGRRAGLVAGLVTALYGPLVFSSGELLHEALLVPLLTVTLALFVWGQTRLEDEDAGVLPWFLGGLGLGFAAITRPSALVLVPAALLAPWVLTRRPDLRERARRFVLPVLAGVLIPILPVTAVNYVSSGDFIAIASQGGINFYAGNNAQADGRHVIVPELGNSTAWGDFLPQITAKAEEAAGRRLKPSAVSDFWTGRGLAWLRSHPADALRLYAIKVGALLSGYEVPNNRDIYVARRDSLLLHALVGRLGPLLYPWGLFVPLVVLGLLAARKRRDLYFFWSFAALYALSLLPFFLADRFRLPLVPFLAPFAALGLLSLPDVLRAPQNARVPIAGALVALLIANLGFGADTRGNPGDAWHKLGEALYNKGDSRGAVEAFTRAIELSPADDLPRLGRAYALQALGQDSLAAEDFRRAAGGLPDSWQAQFGYGEALVRQRRLKDAIPYLEHAAGLMPDRAEIHRELGFAYEATGNYAAAGLALSHALKLGEESADLHLSLGLAALNQGSPEMAEANWKRAIELDPKHFRSLYNLGLLRFNQGRFDEAADLWRKASVARPEDALPHFQLARLAVRQGDRVRAAEEAATAVRLGLDPAQIRRDPLLGSPSGIPAETGGAITGSKGGKGGSQY